MRILIDLPEKTVKLLEKKADLASRTRKNYIEVILAKHATIVKKPKKTTHE